MTQDRLIAIDVESTGFSPARGDRVIEIGAVIVENQRIVDEFHSLINIGQRIPRSAARVHGITESMLIGKPVPEEVIPQFKVYIGGSVLLAHNAQFDMRFLRYEFARLGLGLDNRCLCTLEMCRKRFPRLPDHRLGTVCRHLLGQEAGEIRLHRALDDARMVARIWLEMMKQ